MWECASRKGERFPSYGRVHTGPQAAWPCPCPCQDPALAHWPALTYSIPHKIVAMTLRVFLLGLFDIHSTGWFRPYGSSGLYTARRALLRRLSVSTLNTRDQVIGSQLRTVPTSKGLQPSGAGTASHDFWLGRPFLMLCSSCRLNPGLKIANHLCYWRESITM